jgi:molybdopterin converting factor small subunit
MPVFELPASLRALAGNRARVTVDGQSVGAGLDALVGAWPGLRAALFTEAGALKRTVTLFVGPDDLRDLSGLATPVSEKTVVTLVTALAGG